MRVSHSINLNKMKLSTQRWSLALAQREKNSPKWDIWTNQTNRLTSSSVKTERKCTQRQAKKNAIQAMRGRGWLRRKKCIKYNSSRNNRKPEIQSLVRARANSAHCFQSIHRKEYSCHHMNVCLFSRESFFPFFISIPFFVLLFGGRTSATLRRSVCDQELIAIQLRDESMSGQNERRSWTICHRCSSKHNVDVGDGSSWNM